MKAEGYTVQLYSQRRLGPFKERGSHALGNTIMVHRVDRTVT